MKILLIENRHTVLLWEPIAKRLLAEGHAVHWLVQNHQFVPGTGEIYKIPYPQDLQLDAHSAGCNPDLEFVRSADRNVNYFGGDTAHYPYYWCSITGYLEKLRPDLVMGECTLFHEMMCIRLCRRLSIPYLQPTSCRYPTGRISFYRYDSTDIFGGCGQRMLDEQAREIVDRIASRQLKPDYMRNAAGRIEIFRHRMQRLSCSAEVLWGWLRGERFNTPSPARKWALQRQLRARQKAWDTLAAKKPLSSNRFTVCYPMQMQPEANIDVWGNRYRNQTQLIKDLVAILPADAILMIKPNPKSKYELSADLIGFVENCDRVVAVSHHCTMDTIFSSVDLFVTVMGTIGMECIVSAKPVAILGPLFRTESTSGSFAEGLQDVGRKIAEVRASVAPVCNEAARIEYVQRLHETSYPGITGDPTLNPKALSEANILALSGALRHIFGLIPAREDASVDCAALGKDNAVIAGDQPAGNAI